MTELPTLVGPDLKRDQLVARLRALQADIRERGCRPACALIGSRARGDNRPDSDIDLMIEVDPEAEVLASRSDRREAHRRGRHWPARGRDHAGGIEAALPCFCASRRASRSSDGVAYRALFRLDDIAASISAIRSLARRQDVRRCAGRRTTRAAFERFLEIICEAARHLPEDWRSRASGDSVAPSSSISAIDFVTRISASNPAHLVVNLRERPGSAARQACVEMIAAHGAIPNVQKT